MTTPVIDIKKIPKQVLYILNMIEQVGHDAYLCGGATRDILLGKKPHDYDITTSAPLEVLQSLFPNCKVVGAAFGVVLVSINGLEVQIARFRTEYGYSDYRHPEVVLFTNNIMEDLQRRDFTINTFSMDNKGNLVYYPGALEDLNNGVIRTVGAPFERFKEDGLRLLRTIRFSCQLNFQIDPNTMTSICNLHNLIENISEDRIREELNKILLCNQPSDGIFKLYCSKLLKHIIPELYSCIGCHQNHHHVYNVFGHILEVLQLIPNDFSLRLAALFHDIGKPKCKSIDEKGNIHFYGHEEISAKMAKEIMTRLKYDNQIIDEVVYLTFHHMELMNEPFSNKKAIRKLLNRHGEYRLKKLIEIRRADLLGSGTRDVREVEQLIQNFRSKLEEVLEEKSATKFADLAIDGNDIMEITGLQPGKEIGIIKNEIMEIVLDTPELNQRERLLNIVRGMDICKQNDIKYMKDNKSLNDDDIKEVDKVINIMDEAIILNLQSKRGIK